MIAYRNRIKVNEKSSVIVEADGSRRHAFLAIEFGDLEIEVALDHAKTEELAISLLDSIGKGHAYGR